MSLVDAREISRITARYASELGAFTWEWVVRLGGTVEFRLIRVDSRREKNPWQPVCRLTAPELRRIGTDAGLASELLARLARERGHIPDVA